MRTLLNYLGAELTSEWQVLAVDTVFKKALVLPPTVVSDPADVLEMIDLPHCTIFVLMPDECPVNLCFADMKLRHVKPNHSPHYGLLVLLHKKLFTEPYTYGILQKTT